MAPNGLRERSCRALDLAIPVESPVPIGSPARRPAWPHRCTGGDDRAAAIDTVDLVGRRVAPARRVFRTAWCLPVWVGGSGALLGPGEGDVEVGEDDPLGGGEPVEDGPGGSVGEVQVVEGGEDAATGGFGGAAF